MSATTTLSKFKVKDLLDEQMKYELVWVTHSDTVATVLKVMKDNDILSAPVKDKEGRCIGIIDMLDLVTFCSVKYQEADLLAPDSYDRMEQFAQHTIGALIDISGRNAWREVMFNQPISELFKQLSKSNCHRVGVRNEVGDVVGLVTQFALLQWCEKHKQTFGDKLNKRVGNFDWFSKTVETIHMNKFVIDAFRAIWDKEVTGLAVVNDQGDLVANISASDLKKTNVLPIGLMMQDLFQPLHAFLKIRRNIQEKVMKAEEPHHDPVYVDNNNSIADVLQLVMSKHIHRVFVLDETKKLKGVIALGDFIRLLAA